MSEIKICEALGITGDLSITKRAHGIDVAVSTPHDGSSSLHANDDADLAGGIGWFLESVIGAAGRATFRGVIDKLAPLTGPIQTPEVAVMERDREKVEFRKAAMAYARAELGLDETWMSGGPVVRDPASVEATLAALLDQAERYVAAHLRCLGFAAQIEADESFAKSFGEIPMIAPNSMCTCGHIALHHGVESSFPAAALGLVGAPQLGCNKCECGRLTP